MDVTPVPFEGVKTLKDWRFRDEVFALKKKSIQFISLLYTLVSEWGQEIENQEIECLKRLKNLTFPDL